MTTTIPIAARRYNVQEIDQMRESILFLIGAHVGGGRHLSEPIYDENAAGYTRYKRVWLPYSVNDGEGQVGWNQAEDRLRTYMMGGVSAASLKKEVEEKRKKLQAEVDEKNRFMKEYEMNKNLKKVFKVGQYAEKV